MAGKPICIITPEGLKCLASPIKTHHPGKADCTVAEESDARKKKVKLIATLLQDRRLDLSPAKLEVIAKVAALILDVRLNEDTPFTIVRAG
jgi:hypothetical protein